MSGCRRGKRARPPVVERGRSGDWGVRQDVLTVVAEGGDWGVREDVLAVVGHGCAGRGGERMRIEVERDATCGDKEERDLGAPRAVRAHATAGERVSCPSEVAAVYRWRTGETVRKR